MRTKLTCLVALPFLFACSKSDSGSAADERAESGAVPATSKPVANAEMAERTGYSVQVLGVPAAVTFIGAKLTEAYHPKMPADIVRLDYYGRELEIWAAQKNLAKLTSTAADLKRTWDAVKANEISHGGAAPAAKMDQLVARLDAAKSAAGYAKLATPILDLVDALEKPFEK